jgi:DNA gyrase subunit B
LTFFFRQMPQLIENERIYIAQPPLYEIRRKGQKESEYILNESQMRKTTENRGLEGSRLVIRNSDGSSREFEQPKLAFLVKILNEAERGIHILNRRGIIFSDFVDKFYDGSVLPIYQIRSQGQDEFYYDKDSYEKRLAELNTTQTEGQNLDETFFSEELHEVLRLNEIGGRLGLRF